MSENEQNSNVQLNQKKTLLTQEFNTLHSSISTVCSDTSTGASLPFYISSDPQIPSQNSYGFINGPALPFVYQPIPFAATPEQLQQYFYMMQQQQQPRSNHPKRLKIDNDVSEQLNSFKNSLKSSFEKNLQKLEVLDRLVQTVTMKGNFQVENIKVALEILSSAKLFLKEMSLEQVNLTADLSSDLQGSVKLLKSSLNFVDCSKVELVDKLRKEEDSHLTDLTILSTRNRELQKEMKTVKEQLEKLQSEYAEALKTSFTEREDHLNFKIYFKDVLNCEEDAIFTAFESLLTDNEEIKATLRTSRQTVEDLLGHFQDMKSALKEPINTTYLGLDEVFNSLIDGMSGKFEEILYCRERFYNTNIQDLKGKFDALIRTQSALNHQALNMKMSLQSQLADSHENMARLRKHCQELTLDLNLAAGELDKKRLLAQSKESELSELKRKAEILNDKTKMLEQELSMKNQENRTLGIRIQGLQSELEELSVKHRHDISALERKISILESKHQQTKENSELMEMDPFSSLGRRESLPNATDMGDLSVIPPTVAQKRNVMVTFTGVRDIQKQKELTGWLEELGGTVHVGPDFNDDITHVLAPRGYKSIRVLAASLTGKWIVPVEWVEACHRTQQFVSEVLHGGYLNTSIRPFRYRTIWLSAAFAATTKNNPIYPLGALRVLLEKLGKARWCESAGQADFLLVTEEEKESKLIGSSRGVLLTLTNLIDMIPIE